MQIRPFVNHYEALSLTATATAQEIERNFRQLALRYHPDNQATGDREKFDAVLEAHRTLSTASLRARYHADHTDQLPPLWLTDDDAGHEPDPAVGEAEVFIDGLAIDRDVAIQNHILTLLYQRRRNNIREPGIGEQELEELSGCPSEHLEFHLWYLKSKGWAAKQPDGLMSITIDGVDRAATIFRDLAGRLITDQT